MLMASIPKWDEEKKRGEITNIDELKKLI